jgi:hypothetical protein
MPRNATRRRPPPSAQPRPLPAAEVIDLTDEQSARQSPLRVDNEVEEMHVDLTEDEQPRRNVRQIGWWEEV